MASQIPFPDSGRRRLLGAAAASFGVLALGCHRSDAAAAGATAKALPKTVEIVEFSKDGKRLRTAIVATVTKPDAAWRKQLSPLSYEVTRHEGTERAFTGALLHEKRKGMYRCICCDTVLFDARTKYDSGTGWPSFWQPIAKQNVRESRDLSLGIPRTEIACTRCDAHLGHVFDDGPQPTGLRYCMNSVALDFVPA